MSDTDAELSNVSTVGLGALSDLPPLFWRCLPLPFVALHRFPLFQAAGRCANNLRGGLFIWRVAQRGRFALTLWTGYARVGWH